MRFEDFARLHGLLLDRAYPSARIKRCGTLDHPRSDNGAYFFDGRQGWVRLWDGDGATHWWNDPDAKPWTDAEKRAWAAKREAKKRAEAQGHARAAAEAQRLIDTCVIDRHPYLEAKALGDVRGLVDPDGVLIVPMRHVATNAVMGAQRIAWVPDTLGDDGELIRAHWSKKMLYRMNPQLAVLRLGPPRAADTWLCEGYATGLSLQLALERLHARAKVLVCFSDHNMIAVASQVAGRKFVFADHDRSGAGQRAAATIGVPTAMSPYVGEDANDVHQRAGILAVCRLVMEARTPMAA